MPTVTDDEDLVGSWGPFYFFDDEPFLHIANLLTDVDPEIIAQMRLPALPEGQRYMTFLCKMRILTSPDQALVNYKMLINEQAQMQNQQPVLDPNVTGNIKQADYPLIMPAPSLPFMVPIAKLIHADEVGLKIIGDDARRMVSDQVKRLEGSQSDTDNGGGEA